MRPTGKPPWRNSRSNGMIFMRAGRHELQATGLHCNRFLTAKKLKIDAGEITNRTFLAYKAITDRLISMFGANRSVDDLASDDFESLRADIAKTRGPVSLGNEVAKVRGVFKYGYDAGLIDKPVRYGPDFKRPSNKVLRKHRNKNGERMFEASELVRILDAAGVQLKAMILLAANCAFGNEDCGRLSKTNIDLDNGWISFPRPKTGVQRRCPIWAETVEALNAAIADRPEPKDEADADFVFMTSHGRCWSKDTSANPISCEFRKLLKALDADKPDESPLYREGRGFYAIRHGFRTIADEIRDEPAINRIMGHTDDSMADRYRERINDDRLRAVADHVHDWLFGDDAQGGKEPADVSRGELGREAVVVASD